MAKIAKTYQTVFVEPNVIEASDTRRAFDDAYDLINGGLELNNFNPDLSFNWDNVIGVGTKTIRQTLDVLKAQNRHTFHFWQFGTTTATGQLTIYAGEGIINGKLCKVNTTFTLSNSNIPIYGGVAKTSGGLVVSLPAVNNITASDVKSINLDQISASLAWDEEKQGYYPSYASGTRRVFFHRTYNRFLDPPKSNYYYELTNQEISALGFTSIGITQTQGFTLRAMSRFYDYQTRGYGFNLYGDLLSVSSTVTVYFNSSVPFGSIDEYSIDHATYYTENYSQTWQVPETLIGGSGTTFGYLNMDLNGIISMTFANHGGTFMGGYFTIRVLPNFALKRTFETVRG
jgi:hypothetical protein